MHFEEIGERGIKETFARQQANNDRRTLLAAWINTSTRSESPDFFREH